MITVLLTWVSCFLFYKIKIFENLKVLKDSYSRLFLIFANKNFSDEEKQKELLKVTKFQFLKIIQFLFQLIISLFPFALLYFRNKNFNYLFDYDFILYTTCSAIVFLIVVKFYEKLFSS